MTINVKAHTDHVELSLLNVDGSKDPSIYNFPTKFSPAGQRIWKELLLSPQYQRAKSSFKSRDDNWTWMLTSYLRMCEKSGVMAFKNSSQQSKVDAVTAFMTVARRRAVQFFDSVGMFEKAAPFITSREYIFTPKSFAVLTTAQLYQIKDPTFVAWLQSHPPDGPLFRASGHSAVFTRSLFNNIDSGVSFEFHSANMYRPVMKMLVQCQTPIAYGNTRSLPTEQSARDFAENTIWLPLVRSHRFANVGNRLF